MSAAGSAWTSASSICAAAPHSWVLLKAGRGEQYGEPTADDWAHAAGTISYEIFTCLRNRIPRLYRHAYDVLGADDIRLLDSSRLI